VSRNRAELILNSPWYAFAIHVRRVHYRDAEHLTKAPSRDENGVIIEEIQVLSASQAA